MCKLKVESVGKKKMPFPLPILGSLTGAQQITRTKDRLTWEKQTSLLTGASCIHIGVLSDG